MSNSEKAKQAAREALPDYGNIEHLISNADWRRLAREMVDFYDAAQSWDRACAAILAADPTADCPTSRQIVFEAALDRWDESFSAPSDSDEPGYARGRLINELTKLAAIVYRGSR